MKPRNRGNGGGVKEVGTVQDTQAISTQIVPEGGATGYK